MNRVIAAAGVLTLMLAGTAVAQPSDTVLVSTDGERAIGAGNGSISADGRYVTFATDSRRISPHHAFSIGDVYRKDLRTGRIVLVSRANGLNGHRADDDGNGDAALSADGNFVAFDGSRDLHPDSAEDFSPIYLRDIKRGRLLLVSRASGAHGRVQNNAAYEPDVSRDGRFVAYYSEASNLDPADRDERSDVYVRDVAHNRTILVSRASGARGAHGDGASEGVSISDDGRYVAFVSRASNLDPDDTDRRRDVYVRDLVSNRTVLASRATNGDKADGDSVEPRLSADGRYVAFVFSRGNNLDPLDTDRNSDVYVRDLQTGTTTFVSRTNDAQGNGVSETPSVSADGRRISFESSATNLDPDDTDEDTDVFVRDLDAQTTTLVSRASGAAGAKAFGTERGYSGDSTITPDGRRVIFDTNQDNLDPRDRDRNDDVFVRELGP